MINSKRFLLVTSLAFTASIGLVPIAKSEIVSYTCWNSYPFRGSIVTVPETCYREVYVAPAAPRFNANARLDGDANIRTGASIHSRVIVNTSHTLAIQVHSYSADGDWAYITTSTGAVGWTNKVNILQD